MNHNIDMFDVRRIEIGEAATLHAGTSVITITIRGVDGTATDISLFGPDAITINNSESETS